MNNDDLQHNDLFTLTRMKYIITKNTILDNVLNEENSNRANLKKYNLLLKEKKNKKQCGSDKKIPNIYETETINRKRKGDVETLSFSPLNKKRRINKTETDFNFSQNLEKKWEKFVSQTKN